MWTKKVDAMKIDMYPSDGDSEIVFSEMTNEEFDSLRILLYTIFKYTPKMKATYDKLSLDIVMSKFS